MSRPCSERRPIAVDACARCFEAWGERGENWLLLREPAVPLSKRASCAQHRLLAALPPLPPDWDHFAMPLGQLPTR